MSSGKKLSALNLTVALLLFVTFISLGFWQLNRASDLKLMNHVKADEPAVVIEKLAKPNSNLDGTAINRLVKLKGKYLKTYIAPNQLVKDGGVKRRATLEVRLMQLDSGAGVLVVRGLENMSEQHVADDVQVLGRLYPRQSSDVADAGINELTRIDPSLITSETKLNLLDGYVVAINEKTNLGQAISSERISAERQLPRVAGYYWQHLTYVGIWWLFAILVLVAPFYDRLRERKRRVG